MFVSLIKYLIDPFTIFWLLLLATFITSALKKRYLFRYLGCASLIWFLIISTPLIPTVILNSLEDRYTPLKIDQLTDTTESYHIIVLGGGHGYDNDLPPNSLLSQNALGRLNEGIRLLRSLPRGKLVLSGSTSTPGRTTQAQMLQKTALLLGVDKKALILQNEPKSTIEEAKVYSLKFGNSFPVIVVTSASHMPRAIYSFKKFGIEAIPSPTNYRLLGSWKHKWFGLPDIRNVDNMRISIYEYLALLWYSM